MDALLLSLTTQRKLRLSTCAKMMMARLLQPWIYLSHGLVSLLVEVIGKNAFDYLENRLDEMNLNKEIFWWYLDLRRYGTGVPHSRSNKHNHVLRDRNTKIK